MVQSLYVSRELFEKLCVDIQIAVAAFLRAEDFLEVFNLINGVVVQAGFAEVIFIFTVAHRQRLFWLFELSFANLADCYILHPLNDNHDHVSYF